MTRRQLLALALAGGSLSACGSSDTKPHSEHDLLGQALQFEQLAVLAYQRVLRQSLFTGTQAAELEHFLAQNREHVRVLQHELPGRQSPSDALLGQTLSKHGMSGKLADATTTKDALHLLLDVEALCEGAYYRAVGHLSPGAPVVRCAQALACDAQHTTLLSLFLYPTEVDIAVPTWYVTGVG